MLMEMHTYLECSRRLLDVDMNQSIHSFLLGRKRRRERLQRCIERREHHVEN